MNALTVMLRPMRNGWVVMLSNGRELARFTGIGARRRALRYLKRQWTGREAIDVR